jgi:hypothetical protein
MENAPISHQDWEKNNNLKVSYEDLNQIDNGELKTSTQQETNNIKNQLENQKIFENTLDSTLEMVFEGFEKALNSLNVSEEHKNMIDLWLKNGVKGLLKLDAKKEIMEAYEEGNIDTYIWASDLFDKCASIIFQNLEKLYRWDLPNPNTNEQSI